ncbi:MAG TPA: aminopeptidase P family N-terminal domain-containing protein, partial [Acidimicrobiia bacterium]
MTSPTARLAPVDLPDFGMPTSMPALPDGTHQSRLERLRARMGDEGLDHVVVYADREHSANMSYLTGFDPRFEEALLIVARDGSDTILVGNECVGMADAAPLPMQVRLHQDFSLPGQPRDSSSPLSAELAAAGIGLGDRVGAIGWKPFPDRNWLDIPSFIAEAVRTAVGGSGAVGNVVDILIDPASGLRVVNEVDQIALFEYAACSTSNGVHRLLTGVEPGLTEQEAVALLGWNGAPLSCHLM